MFGDTVDRNEQFVHSGNDGNLGTFARGAQARSQGLRRMPTKTGIQRARLRRALPSGIAGLPEYRFFPD
jgi:DNA-binding phage protein